MSNLSELIAQSLHEREVGSPIAGMIPNLEQEDILALVAEMQRTGQKVAVICAGAGTGKTAQLRMIEMILEGRGQYTAFNRPIVDDARTKFKKASVKTTHQLAFHTVGKLYAHRLPREGGPPKMRSHDIARIMGIDVMEIDTGGFKEDGSPKTRRLTPSFLAGRVMMAIDKFCQSADSEIDLHHFAYIDGIDEPITDLNGVKKRGYTNNNLVRKYLLQFTSSFWEDINRVDGQLPFTHDCYVKIWQLGTGENRPVIGADYILLDEAQDTAPVFLDILRQQEHALLILVGDDNQQIYEWRGAVNAMSSFKGAPRRLLSQSYRYGQTVADVANAVLSTLEEPTDLVLKGNPEIPGRVAKVENPRCYIYRTNAGTISRVMSAIEEGKRPHLIGSVKEIIAWCKAALDLQAKPPRPTQHSELCCFDNWQEVVEYSQTDEGADLKLMVKMIKTFTAEKIIEALKDMPEEKDADLVVTTAHRSKGREWDSVKLGQDFPVTNKMTDPDRKVLYVAATRAKLNLDITECPPFCGGYEQGEKGEETFCPGLEINYTVEMPTEEQQKEWLLSQGKKEEKKEEKKEVDSPSKPVVIVDEYRFTWTKFINAWCARGRSNVEIGTRIKVERRDGSITEVTVKKVVAKYNDAWIYEV